MTDFEDLKIAFFASFANHHLITFTATSLFVTVHR